MVASSKSLNNFASPHANATGPPCIPPDQLDVVTNLRGRNPNPETLRPRIYSLAHPDSQIASLDGERTHRRTRTREHIIMGRHVIDLTGRRFGRWRVLAPKRDRWGVCSFPLSL
jgi:hypothetical protein